MISTFWEVIWFSINYSWSCLHYACYNSEVSIAILKPIVRAMRMTSNSRENVDLSQLFDERSNVIHLVMMQQNDKNMNEVKNVIDFLLRSFDVRQSDMFIWDCKYLCTVLYSKDCWIKSRKYFVKLIYSKISVCTYVRIRASYYKSWFHEFLT